MNLKNLSTQECLNLLITYCSEKGEFPTTREWNEYAQKNNSLSAYALTYRLKKGWYEIRRDLGFESKTKQSFVTKKEQDKILAITHLKLAAEHFGGFLSKDDYSEFAKNNGYISIGRISSIFGKFNNAKIAAGLPVILGKDKYTDKDIVNALKECSEFYNHKVYSEHEYETWRKAQKTDIPHIETIRHRAGFIPEVKSNLAMKFHEFAVCDKDITGEECISIVIKFIDESTSSQMYKEWSKKNNMPDVSTLIDKTQLSWDGIKNKALSLHARQFLKNNMG